MDTQLPTSPTRRTTTIVVVVVALVVIAASVVWISSVLAASKTPTPTIKSGPPTPTRLRSATFTFADTAPSATFECAVDAAPFSACTSPKTYAGPFADGVHTFSVRAHRANAAASSPAVRSWRIDTTPPPAPRFASTPPQATADTTPKFSWSDAEAGVSYRCSLDGSSVTPCRASGSTYKNVAAGSRCFIVVAIDAVANESAPTTYCWTITGPTGFTIVGAPLHALYPGAAPQALDLSISNPHNFAIRVTMLTVSIQPETLNGTCSTSSNFAVVHGLLTSAVIPANSTRLLSDVGVAAADQPQIQMVETNVDQNACKGASLHLNYAGSAVKA